MRPATARAIEVARRQRARTARRQVLRHRLGTVGLGLLLLFAIATPFVAPVAIEQINRYQERQWFEWEKAKYGCNLYTGYCGPEAFDEPEENVQP